MFVLVAIVAITSTFLSTDRQNPINLHPIFHQRTVMDDDSKHLSCSTDSLLSTIERTKFGTTRGCFVYGYPSTGGVLIKEAGLLVMLFLSLPRSHISQRSPSADEEDRLCNLMRRTSATLWPSKEDWMEVQFGTREATLEEEKVLVFGWPTDEVGVWVLRFGSARQIPGDFWENEFSDEYGGEDIDDE
jgi:hypothetical protein